MRITPFTLFCTLGTVVCWGVWGTLGKRALDQGVSPMNYFVAQMLAAAVGAGVVLGVWVATRSPVAWPAVGNPAGLGSAVALVVGLLLFSLALQKGQANFVVTASALYPVVAVLLNFAFLGERPTLTQCVGLVLAIVSLPLLMSGGT